MARAKPNDRSGASEADNQNKLTNDRAYAALPHLDYRHFFCPTKPDFMNFDYHQTHVDGVQRFSTSIACSERRARRPTKFAGVCGFSADAIFMEGCRLFQKRPKNRIPTIRVTNDSTITQS